MLTAPERYPPGEAQPCGFTAYDFAVRPRTDTLELVVLPVLFGAGMRLTDSLSPHAELTLECERALPGGSVEIVYAVDERADELPGRDPSWSPASRRPRSAQFHYSRPRASRASVRLGVRFAAVSASIALSGCGGQAKSAHVTLTASPTRALADVPVAVEARGLAPHAAVTLRASWAGFGRQRADSAVRLRADGSGRVNLRGFDGARVLWGMRVTPAGGLFALPATDDTVVHLTLTDGDEVLARAEVHRRLGTRALRSRPLSFGHDRLVGWFFAPPGSRRRPAVLAIGGSEGGVGTVDLAALLASHGHPTLALGYFGLPGLPSRLERIPLEYFQRGLRWLARQPSVDPEHVTMLGISRGAEATWLSGIDFPKLVHAAIPYLPQPDPIHFGGTQRATALAKTELWPRILHFLDDHVQ